MGLIDGIIHLLKVITFGMSICTHENPENNNTQRCICWEPEIVKEAVVDSAKAINPFKKNEHKEPSEDYPETK